MKRETTEKTCRNCERLREFLDVWECDECPAWEGRCFSFITNPDDPADACSVWKKKEREKQ